MHIIKISITFNEPMSTDYILHCGQWACEALHLTENIFIYLGNSDIVLSTMKDVGIFIVLPVI